jgi:heme-degrading monooxygenase HmoA
VHHLGAATPGVASTEDTTMLARLWRGATTAADADAYLDYLGQTGVAEYRATEGNMGVLTLRRVVDGRAEFLLVTLWKDEDAVRRFAGADVDRAVFYPEDDGFLVDRDDHVTHYEVVGHTIDLAP